MLRHVSTRTWVAAAFAVVMIGLSATIGLLVYTSVRSALLDEVDSALRFRGAAYAARPHQPPAPRTDPRLQEPRESFFQLLTRGGRVLDVSEHLTHAPLLPAATVAGVRRPKFFTEPVTGVQDVARLLALPQAGGQVLVVGETLADRTDALHELATVLWVGLPVAIVLASVAGWLVAGLGLRAVERMRRQAAAISRSDSDHRLDVPAPNDEVRRLAITLNEMLDRLEEASRRDREFLMRAGHELRTPLTSLQAELELAETGSQDVATLSAAIRAAGEETDRLVTLANDLLAEARIRDGRLPVTRARCSLPEVLDAAAHAHAARAARHGVTIVARAPEVTVCIDAQRTRQALDNLVDNALRHGRNVATVELAAECRDDVAILSVTDDGEGSPPALERPAPGGGLGLRIAAAVAAGHGGTLQLLPRQDGGITAALQLAAVDAEGLVGSAARVPGTS